MQEQYPILMMDPRTVELIERVVYDEARGEGIEGRNAVRAVIYNRMAANRPDFGGKSPLGVLNARGQFQGVWEKGRGNAANLPFPKDVRDSYLREHLEFVQSGQDPTNGATFFLNKKTAARPFNKNQRGIKIGNHEFFNNYNGNKVEVPEFAVAMKGFGPEFMGTPVTSEVASGNIQSKSLPAGKDSQPSIQPYRGKVVDFFKDLFSSSEAPSGVQPASVSSVQNAPQNAPMGGMIKPYSGQIVQGYDQGGLVGFFGQMPDSYKTALGLAADFTPDDYESEELMSCGMMMPEMYDLAVGVDPVSGNPIPPGSSPENVRDDIPAVLSNGEYVVPADVVRYHGLKTFMALRDEAKLGLMSMYYEGQIQTINDEDLEEPQEEEPVSEDTEEPVVSDEEDSAEEGDEELSEGEYETPEGNMVETPEVEIEIEGMEVEGEEKPEYAKEDFLGDEELIKIFMTDPKAFKRI